MVFLAKKGLVLVIMRIRRRRFTWGYAGLNRLGLQGWSLFILWPAQFSEWSSRLLTSSLREYRPWPPPMPSKHRADRCKAFRCHPSNPKLSRCWWPPSDLSNRPTRRRIAGGSSYGSHRSGNARRTRPGQRESRKSRGLAEPRLRS